MKVLLSKEEIALQLYEHLRTGILDGKVKFAHTDNEWAKSFIYLFNLANRAKDDPKP